MDKFAEIIKVIINPLIIIGGVGVLAALVYISMKLEELRKKVGTSIYGITGKPMVNRKNLSLKQRDTALIQREDIYPDRNAFNELCSQYSTWSQLIPVFPLLGILGTVAGLILQVRAMDAAAIYSSLDVALSSTLLGLIAAIVLKVVESASVLKKINDIETMFSDQDLKYQDAIALKNFDEENDK